MKQSYVEFRLTSDDVNLRPPRTEAAIPQSPTSHRDTWPTALKERSPGTYQFDVTPTLTPTPWELERARRPPSQWSRNSDKRRKPSRVHAELPREMLHFIFAHLKASYTSSGTIDATAFRRDLLALCLANKQWHRVAREHLYREICLPSSLEPTIKMSQFRKSRSKLRLLLRTVEEAPGIAIIVLRICITATVAHELESDILYKYNRRPGSGSALELLRGIIIRCSNLEHLSGYAPTALDITSGVLAALSSRDSLKSHIWRFPHDHAYPTGKLSSSDILNCHVNWQHLETLVLWKPPASSVMDPGTISAIVQRLPSLKHLMVQGLLPTDFHNGTLLMLPALKSLRLDGIHGVTDQGIGQLAHSRLAMSLERLTFRDLELTSLQTFQILFDNMPRLRKLALAQDTSPDLPQWISATSRNFLLGSTTLQYLHWDVALPSNDVAILANSIGSGKFPSLQIVNVPCDYDGAIQNLCRPVARHPITSFDLAAVSHWEERWAEYRRSLRVSQTQAQIRIRQQLKQPSFNVVVQDEDQEIEHTHMIGSYLGNMASQIEYSLSPAIEGTANAIAHFEEVAIATMASDTERTDFSRHMPGETNPDKHKIVDVDILF